MNNELQSVTETSCDTSTQSKESTLGNKLCKIKQEVSSLWVKTRFPDKNRNEMISKNKDTNTEKKEAHSDKHEVKIDERRRREKLQTVTWSHVLKCKKHFFF